MAYNLTKTLSANPRHGSVNSTQYTSLGSGYTMIQADGAAFVSSGVIPGDGVGIDSSTSNDSVGVDNLVVYVMNETMLVVRNSHTTEAGAGTVVVSGGAHQLDIVDETDITWHDIVSAVALPEIVSREYSSASVAFPEKQYSVFRAQLRDIDVQTPNQDSVWRSQHDVVFRPMSSISGTGLANSMDDGFLMTHSTASGDFTWEIGKQVDSGDRSSVTSGSVWIGVNFGQLSNETRTRFRASYLSITAGGGNSINLRGLTGSGNGECFGCLIPSTVVMQANTLELQDVMSSEGQGFVGLTDVEASGNLIVQDSANAGLFLFASADVVVEGLKLSDSAFTPAINLFTTQLVEVRNPQEDYTFSELFAAGATTLKAKSYTWRPRIVKRNAPHGPTDEYSGDLVVPVSGATVDAALVSLTPTVITPSGTLSAGDYTITINGDDFTVTNPASRAALCTSMQNAINAGAQPVTAVGTNNFSLSDNTRRAVRITPDDLSVPIHVETSAPNEPWEFDATAQVSGEVLPGSPFTSDGDGFINSASGIVVQTHKERKQNNTEVDRRILAYRVSAPGFRPIIGRLDPTKETEEDVVLEPWNPNRTNPRRN